MKIAIIALAVFLTACSTTVPVKQKFPDAPPVLMEKCQQLKTVAEDKGTLREFLKTVIENYSLHYQCADKVQGWQDWYQEQKRIFEGAK
jgi:PBP1b-binding outer membrane lipoprotein LpoB